MTPRFSRVAQMQQALTLFWAGATVASVWSLWPVHPLLAALVGVAVACVHGLPLAFEFLLLPFLAAKDPAPRAGLSSLLRAWLMEMAQCWRVFAWRQPFHWRAQPDRLEGDGARGRRGVVLVHGFVCNRGFWGPWLEVLTRDRRAFVAVNLEPPFASIDHYVPAIEAAVAQVRAATGRAPLLVCHSMGGLVARAWLAKPMAEGNADLVDHVVTIGSPHRGTWLARFSQARNGRQMRIGSKWLEQLGQAWHAGVPHGLPARFTCWYSNADNIVMPPSTATLPGADNRFIQGVPHVDMAFQPEVMAHAMALLARPD